MSTPRVLVFKSEADVIAEVERLRSGYAADGNWSLPQACWHLGTVFDMCLHAPTTHALTDEQKEMRPLLDGLLQGGTMPPGVPADPRIVPPASVPDSAVDGFINGLTRMRDYPESHVSFGPFGPATNHDFRRFVFIHSALHLGMLHPTA